MLILGKEVSKQTREEIKVEVDAFKKTYGRAPTLAVIIVGDDPASQTYVRNKVLGCEEVGMRSLKFEFLNGTPQKDIAYTINSLVVDNTVDGILIQLPLPKGYDEKYLLDLIPETKDVDGFCASNIGLLAMNQPRTISCTPFGIMKLLASTNVDLNGKHAVVIGRSNTVGKPMAMLLLNANCTVTICHSKTQNLKEITRAADILVVAIGKPKFLKADMVKDGAIVIDVGINRVDGHLVGDVDFDEVEKKASFITPVPGGVGPMTISMLLYNTLAVAKDREENARK